MAVRPLASAAASDPGRQRENNEDRVLADPERGIFAVVDGVGGESAGEVAAETAVDVLRARLSRRTAEPERLVREAIALANKQIYERSLADPRLAGMSCVLTVAILEGTEAIVGHVGDSRLYRLRPGRIEKITRDHAPVGEREDAGELSEAEAMRHPRRNEIFRDVGSGPHEPDDPDWIDVERVPFTVDSALLLCSDGLTDLVTSQGILDIVERHAGDLWAAVKELIAAANAAGGRDNVSAVLVAGEQFAAAVARRLGGGAPAAVSASGGVRGAAYARPSGPGRWFRSPWAVLSLLVLALLAAFFFFRQPLEDWIADWTGKPPANGIVPPPPAAVLTVGSGAGSLPTIAAALAAARPGQTIEVAPGEYAERIILVDGVALVSAVPRAAILRPPAGDSGGLLPVVLARGVHGARLAGFLIAPQGESVATPLAVGLRVEGGGVEIEDLEVMGARRAAIEIAGSGRAALRLDYIHDNPGTGVAIGLGASPHLVQNLISGNGQGVVIAAGAQPLLADNRIVDNARGVDFQVRTPSVKMADEIFAWNNFGSLKRERAVEPAPVRASTPAPTRPPHTISTPAAVPRRPRRNG